MDEPRTSPFALAAVGACLCLVLAGSAQAAGPELRGLLETAAEVDLDGSVNATADHAAVDVRTQSLETELHADRIETRIEWEEGYATAERPGGAGYSHAGDVGVDWHNFSSADVRLDPLPGVPHVLALPGTARASVSATTPDPVSASTVENETLAQWGVRSEAGTFPAVGFWYTIDEPRVSLVGADRATVAGNFTLFVNNVTIRVPDSEQGPWSNWTGYREHSPTSPAGPLETPSAREYEVRSTTLRVTNGTLWINATDAVGLYASDANATVDGSMHAPTVSGELVREPRLYRYDGHPLQMWGRGRLDLGLASLAQGKAARAPGPGASTSPLTLAPSGSFDVRPTSGVEVADAETTGAWNPLSWFGQGTWLALAFLATAALGAGVGATVPERVHAILGDAFGGWRDRQYKRWVRDAEMAIEDGDLDRAETLASRAISLIPEAPDGWMTLAIAHFASDEPARALDTFQDADRALDRMPGHLLDLWTTYALQVGEEREAVEAWLALADARPERALMMYVEENMASLHGHERVEARARKLRAEVLGDHPELAALVRDRRDGAGEDTDGDGDRGPEVA